MKITHVFMATMLASSMFASGATAETSTIRTSINSDLRGTEPGTNRDNNTDAVLQHVVEGLVAYRENFEVGPMLAESIDVSEDGKAYTFKLRKDVKFHNGAILTSKDVLWTWKRLMTPEIKWRCLTNFDGTSGSKLLSFDAKDDSTVVFTFDKPSAVILANMARTDCGASGILHPDSVDANGKWISPIGTGPFKLGEWKTDQYVELDRFPNYVPRSEPRDGLTGEKRALVDKIRYMVIPDVSAAKAALMAGDIDSFPEASSNDIAEYQALPDMKVEAVPTMGVSSIMIQGNDPVMKDIRMRKALASTIDYAVVATSVSNNTATPNNSWVPTKSSFYSETTAKAFPYDLDGTRKLLQEAGYTGQPLKMTTTKRYPNMFDQAVLVQAMAQQAGLNIELEVIDWASMLDRFNQGKFQLMSFSYGARMDPSLSYDNVIGLKSVMERKQWESPEAIALLAESIRSSDTKARQAAFDKLHLLMLEEVPFIPLYNDTTVTVNRKLDGYLEWPALVPRYWNVSKK